ncbi:hypothetical protein VFPPC_05112 [Pochonia chlamydosporia 170]|uniref:Phospholipase A2 n=1 Tax=Pochonia chlamydosporia 170 TaxID=1380566 RepID=A0A179FTK9_METCM|nr:hypothetical protein VFPPC_05112 [Pochonia chlamydosporia 170]OAQ68965.1 hypothetical protein VFPPC_05112 [Pochonia chlamydosporia 170]
MMLMGAFVTRATVSGASPSRSPNSASLVRNEDGSCTSAGKVAETDRLLFNVDMITFTRARDAQNPPCLDWSSDGCTHVPDAKHGIFDFRASCRRHDFGYRNAKAQGRCSQHFKKRVDQNFKADMKRWCKDNVSWFWHPLKRAKCASAAEVYYGGVRELGNTAWCK